MKLIKTALVYTLQPKAIIFGLALFNFFYIYSKVPPIFQTGETISFYNREWYETADFVDVIILLFAAFLLMIGRKWSYLAAGALSGIIVVEGLIHCFRISLLEVWKFVQKNELDVLLQWEIQFVLAIIIFSATIFYLIRETLRKDTLR